MYQNTLSNYCPTQISDDGNYGLFILSNRVYEFYKMQIKMDTLAST